MKNFTTNAFLEELFEPRVEAFIESVELTNLDRAMLRLRSNQARGQEDARYTLKFLRLLLPSYISTSLAIRCALNNVGIPASRPRISRGDTGGGLVATQWCYTAATTVHQWLAALTLTRHGV